MNPEPAIHKMQTLADMIKNVSKNDSFFSM